MNPTLKKTALALAVGGTFVAASPADANVINLSWRGAFTMINPAGVAIYNSGSDYQGARIQYANGYYANGAAGFGTPQYWANAVNGTPSTHYAGAVNTIRGWKSQRTPISGTMSFDTSNGVGVGTVNPFFFFGDTPGSGAETSVAHFPEVSFQQVDTLGTVVGTMLMSWNGIGNSISIVLDASSLFASLPAAATTTISGVGTLPATDGTNFGTTDAPLLLPLGPSPAATKTLNAVGCEAQPLATQINAYTIISTGNIANCSLTQDDGIGGSPMVSTAFGGFSANFDFTTFQVEPPLSLGPVPLPPAIWLFGSGLLGLIGLARCKKSDQ